MRRARRCSAYEAPVSLWSLVEQHVPDSEQTELKNLLGDSLVDQSIELQQEVGLFVDIWREVEEEREQTRGSPRQLPEPPGVRDRLVQQILFYVDSINEKVAKDGRDPIDVLSRCKVDVIDYACDSARGSSSASLSRPSTARSSKDGGRTPSRQTPSSDRALSIASVEEAMCRQLNVLDMDEVLRDLTDYLRQEVQQLLDDIPFLQECIEHTNEADSDDDYVEPTLHDLREERTKLERELLSASPPTVPNMPTVGAKSFKTPTPPPASRASAAGDRRRPRGLGKTSTGPVKASHTINVRVVELPDNVNPPVLPSGEDNNNYLVKVTSPTSANQRPSSADRFRRMVIGCRDRKS